MPSLPPELRVEIRKTGDQFLAVTTRPKGQEICSSTFTHDADKLIHFEPQWMLEKGARTPSEALREEEDKAGGHKPRPDDDQLLIKYGQRLHGYLFGDGTKLKNFLEFNDAYRREARLTLCLHPEAAALWSLPWEYLHDGQEFMCLNGRLLINRLPLALGELNPAETAPPLRILVVIAGPDDQGELDFEKELAVIQDALDDARREGLVEVDFLDDATFDALRDTLSRETYHVLHYTGHGAYSEIEKRGLLCFEDAEGKSDLIGADKLRPLLTGTRDLRLVVLSACQSAKTGGLDAFDSVATGLLHADAPAVLAMQFSVLDDSAIEMARVLYTELARGRTPAEALNQARQAMRHHDDKRPPELRRFDWGVPALYLRAPAMRLIDPDAIVETRYSASPRDFGGLPLPRVFVGRRPELRRLRRALREHATVLCLRGMGGIGKSTVAAKLLDRPGTQLDGALVIRCHELTLPADGLTKLANFWQAQGLAGHAEAAALLLDSSHDPADRARAALQMIGDRRYLVVFDNLETWIGKSEVASPKSEVVPSSREAFLLPPSSIADPTIRSILHGLLTAKSKTTFLFTSRYRWEELESLPATNRLEIHLPGLTVRQAVLLMNALPHLKDEPLADKLAVFQRVGGHPKTIELLDGWLSDGRRLRALLDDQSLGQKLADEWERYFLDDLLTRLSPAERTALTTLAILEEPFWQEMANELLTNDEGRRMEGSRSSFVFRPSSFLDLSLIQFHSHGTNAPLYALHPLVREYLLNQLSEAERRALHLRAAAYYGKPFIDAARQFLAESGQTATEEQIQSLARDDQGVIGAWVRQTQNMKHAHWTMQRAIAWQNHLFQAGKTYTDAAGEIVHAVYDMLARWGQRDAAKILLRRSIDTMEGSSRAAAQGNLASLLAEEGRLAEALETHELIYQTFSTLDAKAPMSVALNMQSQVLQDMGEYDRAIEKQLASLKIKREIGNEAGQAISLHQLSILYMIKEDYDTALRHSQDAEALFRKLGVEAHVAASLHQQGVIFTDLNRPAEAFERFRESLEIKSRIGDESGAADSLGELGKLLSENGQMREAIAAFNEALEIYQRQGNPKIAAVLSFLGNIHEKQEEYTAALEKYQQALAIDEQYGSPQDIEIDRRDIARVRGKR